MSACRVYKRSVMHRIGISNHCNWKVDYGGLSGGVDVFCLRLLWFGFATFGQLGLGIVRLSASGRGCFLVFVRLAAYRGRAVTTRLGGVGCCVLSCSPTSKHIRFSFDYNCTHIVDMANIGSKKVNKRLIYYC